MSDIENIIADSLNDAEAGILEIPAAESTSDDTPTTESDTTEVSPTAGEAAEVEKPATAAPVVDEDLQKELAEAGFKPAQPGQRENRLPWSRVQKILENTRKKLKESHATATKDWETKYAAADKRAKEADQWDQFIASDPDGSRTMQFLAQIHPQKFQRFLQPQVQPTAQNPSIQRVSTHTTAPAADPNDPRPAPKQFADGSTGYDEQGLADLMAWSNRQAVKESMAAMDARQKESAEQARKLNETRARITNENNHRINLLKQAWGDLYVNDDPEVTKLMKQGYPLETAAQIAWAPKQKVSEQAMREKLLKEIADRSTVRKAAATKSPTAAAPAAPAATGETDLKDIVARAVAASGIR